MDIDRVTGLGTLKKGSMIPFLFLDKENHPVDVKICAERAEKRQSPIFEDDPVGSSQYATVIFDKQIKRYRMWYNVFDHPTEKEKNEGKHYKGVCLRHAYAESGDGEKWVRPGLGLVELEGRENNNFIPNGSFHPLTIIDDILENDPKKRFKSVATGSGNQTFTYSPDGFTWHRPEVKVIKGKWRSGFHESICMFVDREAQDPAKKYMIYCQALAEVDPTEINRYLGKSLDGSKKYSTLGSGKAQRRKIGVAHGSSLNNIKIHKNMALDPDHSIELQIHGISVMKYEGYYVAFYEPVFFDDEWRLEYTDVNLAVSRDGLEFKRLDICNPVIQRGTGDEWDAGSIITPNQPVKIGDELVLFYSGGPKQAPLTGVAGRAEDDGYERISDGYCWQLGKAWLPYDSISCVRVAEWKEHGSILSDLFVIKDNIPGYIKVNLSKKAPRYGAGDMKAAVGLALCSEDGRTVIECGQITSHEECMAAENSCAAKENGQASFSGCLS